MREPSWALADRTRLVHAAAMPKLQLVELRRGPKDGSSSPRSEQHRQVAAVCYRLRHGGIEFLLVRTSKGRWTFPKGGIKTGWTQAESAALEAFEEAGVHGRIEEIAFARYRVRKRGMISGTKLEVTIHAHLCEVKNVVPAQEANRCPSWFAADETKKQLSAGRKTAQGNEFMRVVDRAVARVRRMETRPAFGDGLQRVHFEAAEIAAAHARSGRIAYVRAAGKHSAGMSVTGFSEVRAKVVRLLPARVPNS